MRVALGSIEVTDALRRAVRARLGRPGLATRQEIRDLVLAEAGAFLNVVRAENEKPRALTDPGPPTGEP